MDYYYNKSESIYDRLSELKAFDDSKAGVKGLVDAGITKIPRIFHYDPKILSEKSVADSKFTVPVIDLEGIHGDSILCDRVVRKARDACQNWGVFQVVNHGIPTEMLDDMIEGIRRFHELETEVKKKFYSQDLSRKVVYLSNYGLYRNLAASWLDSLGCFMAPHPPKPEAMPAVCRDIIFEFSKEVMKLGNTLFEILSEALGLKSKHLEAMGCGEDLILLGHYYPTCPEPELTMGITKHSFVVQLK